MDPVAELQHFIRGLVHDANALAANLLNTATLAQRRGEHRQDVYDHAMRAAQASHLAAKIARDERELRYLIVADGYTGYSGDPDDDTRTWEADYARDDWFRLVGRSGRKVSAKSIAALLAVLRSAGYDARDGGPAPTSTR